MVLLLAYVLLVQRRNGDLHALLDAQLEQEKERAAFIRELNHRVKNTLANVTSMIALGFVVATAAIAVLVHGVEKRYRVAAPAE